MLTRRKVALLYNLASVLLWASLLIRFAVLLPLVGRKFLPGGIADFFCVVATVPSLDLFNGLFGITRNKLGLTLLSMVSRLSVVWLVIWSFPKVAKHSSFSTLIFSWGLSYTIQYFYHTFKLATGGATPRWLRVLHHNKFILLYPLSVASEMCLIFLSLPFADKYDPRYAMGLRALLLLYIPSFYIMYSYMFTKRDERAALQARHRS